MAREDGGPAFPRPTSTDETINPANIDYAEPGMALRDWFAGQALVGLLAIENTKWELTDGGHANTSEQYATAVYRIADAMLAERGGWNVTDKLNHDALDDLYEALVRAANALRSYGEDEQTRRGRRWPLMDRIEAALAKARSE